MIDAGFLYLIFNSFLYWRQINKYLAGSAQGGVNASTFSKLTVPLPSIFEQRRIVSILVTVDNAVQKTQEIIDQTQRIKQGLMQQLLTRGSGHTKFKNSVLGEMPEEWSVTTLGDEFDVGNIRYNKIIIMTDADVDGAHIRTLILTFLYRYMHELIEKGHVYIAQPPLYQAKNGKEIFYAYNEDELNKVKERFSGKKIAVQQYKGLGEMDPIQLWDTTMNPETRILLKIEIEDALIADDVFSTLMGSKVEPRREFIEKNAKGVSFIDI